MCGLIVQTAIYMLIMLCKTLLEEFKNTFDNYIWLEAHFLFINEEQISSFELYICHY